MLSPWSLESIERKFVKICEPDRLYPVSDLREKCISDLQFEFAQELKRCYAWSETLGHPALKELLERSTDSRFTASIISYREYGCDMRLTLKTVAYPKQPKDIRSPLHAPSIGFVSTKELLRLANDRALAQTRVEYRDQLRLLLDLHRRYSSEHQLSQRSTELERLMLCDEKATASIARYISPKDDQLELINITHTVYQHTIEQRLMLRKIEAEMKIKAENHGENSAEWNEGGRAAVDDGIADNIKRIQSKLEGELEAWIVYKEKTIRHHKVMESSAGILVSVSEWTQRLQRVLKWFSSDRLSDYVPREHLSSLQTARSWSHNHNALASIQLLEEMREAYRKDAPNRVKECDLWIKCSISCIRLTQWNYLTQALAHVEQMWNTPLPAIRIETMTDEITKLFNTGLQRARSACDKRHLAMISSCNDTWRLNVCIPLEAWTAYVKSNPFQSAASKTLETMEEEYTKIEGWIQVKTQCVSHMQDLMLHEWMRSVHLNRKGAGIGCRLSSPKFTELYGLIQYLKQEDSRNRPIHLGQWIRALAFLCVGTFLHASALIKLDP